MTTLTRNTTVFSSNENGLRFDVDDPVTLKTISNPEKKDIVHREAEGKSEQNKASKPKKDNKPQKENGDNEQEL